MRDELSELGSGTERPPALVATFVPNGPYRTSMVKTTVAMAKAPPPVPAIKREPDRRAPPPPRPAADADAPPEHIGQYLRKAREHRAEELGDIWRTLKIAEHHLIAIEEGRFDALPGRVYAIGFVRSYAIYLGLDAEECIERLKEEMAKRGDSRPLSSPVAKHDALGAFDSEIAEDDEIGALPSESPKRGTVSALHSKITEHRDISALHSEIAERRGISALQPESAKVGAIRALLSERAKHGDTSALHSNNAGRISSKPVVGLMPSSERGFQQSNWAVTGLCFAALVFFGYYLFASVGRVSPPPVIPVPERLAAEAGLTQKAVTEPLAKVEREAASIEPPAPPSPDPVSVPAQPAPPIEVATLPLPVSVAAPPAPRIETPPPQQISVPAQPAPRVDAQLPQPVAVPAQQAQRVEGLAQIVSVPAEPAAKIEAARPAVQRYGIQNRNSRITLRVHRRTRVAVLDARNRDFIDRILAPGETYLVPNVRGLRLTASDGGAVELVLDGVSVGRAGKDGVRASGLSLNLQSVLERRLSR